MNKIMIASNKWFVYLLSCWCIVNTIAVINCNSMLQYIAIVYAIVACGIIIYNFFVYTDNTVNFCGVGYGVIMVVGSIITLISTRFSGLVGNVYGIFALSVNFILLYSCKSEIDYRKLFVNTCRIIVVGGMILTVVSIFLLMFRIVIPLETSERQGVIIMGLDNFHSRFTGVTNNPNVLGQLAITVFLASLFLSVFDDNIKNIAYKVFIIITMLVSIYCIFIVESRGDLFSFWIGISATVLLYIIVSPSKFKTIVSKLFFSILAIIIFVIGIYILPKVGELFITNFPYVADTNTEITIFKDKNNTEFSNDDPIHHNDGSNKESSSIVSRVESEQELLEQDITNGRFALMTIAVKATLEKNPVLGISYALTSQVVQEYATKNNIELPDYIFKLLGNSHNTISQVYICYGFIGLIPVILLLLLFVKIFVRIFRVRKLTERQCRTLMVFFLLFSTCGALSLVEATFLLSFDNNVLNFLLMLALGCFIMYVKEMFGEDVLKDKVSEFIQLQICKFINFLKKIGKRMFGNRRQKN